VEVIGFSRSQGEQQESPSSEKANCHKSWYFGGFFRRLGVQDTFFCNDLRSSGDTNIVKEERLRMSFPFWGGLS